MTQNPNGEGVFTLLDGDSSDAEIETAVRVLLGLSDDYDFESEGEKDFDQAKHLRDEYGR